MGRAGWDGVLLDIDGVLHVGDDETPGAIAALKALRQAQVPVRLVTNTTSRPRGAVAERLQRIGFDVVAADILTPAALAVKLCQERGYERVALVVAHPLREDLTELRAVDTPGSQVDAVIVGDLGAGFNYRVLNAAFRSLLKGAELIALQRNRYWRSREGIVLDAGPFVAALEYAIDRPATVIGKPSADFFAAAVQELGIPAGRVVMVGDDVEADVGGAIDAGLAGVLVKTGKYRAVDVDASSVEPTMVIESIIDVPALVGATQQPYT